MKTKKPTTQHHMVQPTLQQKRSQHRPKIPQSSQQALPERFKVVQDLLPKHTKDKLQLHAKHGRYHQAAQRHHCEERIASNEGRHRNGLCPCTVHQALP